MGNLNDLTDQELIVNLRANIGEERSLLIRFLLTMNEIGHRRTHQALGWPSLFKFLVGQFNFSEPSAAKRLSVARLIDGLPGVVEYLEDGRLHLSGAYILAKYLHRNNYIQVLDACSNKSKLWIVEYVSKEFQANCSSSKRDVIRCISPLPRRQMIKPASVVGEESLPPLAVASISNDGSSEASPKAGESDLVRISTTLDRKTLYTLRRLQEILAADSLATVIAKASRFYLNKIDPLSAPIRNTKLKHSPTSRSIPKKIKHHVFVKAKGRCEFIGENGRRCEERSGLEIDHIIPFSLGGLTVEANLRLLCRSHNLYAARQIFGNSLIDQKIAETTRLSQSSHF